MLKPSCEPALHFPQLARSLAQHFEMELEVVEDVLATLSVDRHLNSHVLEEQAMVMLSGMCDDSDSSSEGDSETDGHDEESSGSDVQKRRGHFRHYGRRHHWRGNRHGKRGRFA